MDKGHRYEEALTRQEVAVFLKCLLALYLNRNMYGNLVPMDKALLKHPDASEINKYAIESMNFMVLNGFISADPFNRLNPNAIVSRADLAVIMEKLTETDLEALVW